MKNLLIIIFILVATISYSQTPPPRNATSINANSVKQKNYSKIVSAQTKTKQEKKSVLIEIKVLRTDKGDKIILPEIETDYIKDRNIISKIGSLMKLPKIIAEKDDINLVLELSKMGFKFVSHEFAFKKDTEVHYYIFEI